MDLVVFGFPEVTQHARSPFILDHHFHQFILATPELQVLLVGAQCDIGFGVRLVFFTIDEQMDVAIHCDD